MSVSRSLISPIKNDQYLQLKICWSVFETILFHEVIRVNSDSKVHWYVISYGFMNVFCGSYDMKGCVRTQLISVSDTSALQDWYNIRKDFPFSWYQYVVCVPDDSFRNLFRFFGISVSTLLSFFTDWPWYVLMIILNWLDLFDVKYFCQFNRFSNLLNIITFQKPIKIYLTSTFCCIFPIFNKPLKTKPLLVPNRW